MNHDPMPPITELLLHRGTMLLLDRATAIDAETATTEYTPRADAWYADADGWMPAWFGIELMAQTVAAKVNWLKRYSGSSPKYGVLLGTRHYRSARPAFAPGETLTIHAKIVYRDASGFGAYDCRIEITGATIASATLKVFEPDNLKSLFAMELQ